MCSTLIILVSYNSVPQHPALALELGHLEHRRAQLDLTTNSFSEVITLTGGIGEAYTPTVIGTDGTVYAINRAVLFAIGK